MTHSEIKVDVKRRGWEPIMARMSMRVLNILCDEPRFIGDEKLNCENNPVDHLRQLIHTRLNEEFEHAKTRNA